MDDDDEEEGGQVDLDSVAGNPTINFLNISLESTESELTPLFLVFPFFSE
jgi:hypothetical protein